MGGGGLPLIAWVPPASAGISCMLLLLLRAFCPGWKPCENGDFGGEVYDAAGAHAVVRSAVGVVPVRQASVFQLELEGVNFVLRASY